MAQEAGSESTRIHLSCFCKQITASATVPNAELPCQLSLCHCDTCRHHTGSLAYTAARLPTGSHLELTGKPRGYRPFQTSAVERFFCENCGTMIYETTPDDGIILCTGALTDVEGIVKLQEQIFVGDPKDGGCSIWFPKLKSWEGWDGKSPESDLDGMIEKSSTKLKAVIEPERLLCYCHCKGVQFAIKPASSVTTPNDIERFRLQEGGTKYLASFCVCNDCRFATGHDLQPWAYVPEACIQQLDGSPVVFSSHDGFDLGTAKQYRGSDAARREFCGRCGATLFWHAASHDPGRIDVSVGLMAAHSGARAEEWLSWRTTRVSHRGLEQNQEIVAHLVEGLEGYGARRA